MSLPAPSRENGRLNHLAPVYSVLIEESRRPIPLVVLRNNQPVHSDIADIPFALQPFTIENSPYNDRLVTHFNKLLNSNNFIWPIYIKECGQIFPVKISREPRQGKILLNRCHEGISIQRILDDKSFISPRIWRSSDWVIDFYRKEIIRLTSDHWNLWDSLSRDSFLQPDGSLLLSESNDHYLELIGDADQAPLLDDIIIVSQDREQNPELRSASQYRIEVEASDEREDLLTVYAQLMTSTQSYDLSRRALPLFCAETFAQVSAPIKTIKRRTIIFDAFFAASKTKNPIERSRLLRSIFQGPDFRKRVLVREAKGLIEEGLAQELHSNWLLHTEKDQWVLQKRNHDIELQIIEILYRNFELAPFREALYPGRISVSRSLFYNRLPALLAELATISVELSLDGQQASQTALDITVTTKSSGIDWFELHPKIRFKESLLSEDQWRQAVADGVFTAGGKLYLLDQTSLQALKLLAGMAPSRDKKKNSQIIRIPRLHILDCISLRRLGVNLELSAEDEKILDSLEHYSELPELPRPLLLTQLRSYQQYGYSWLAFLYQHKFGACLADDMGLGKTIQAISLLCALKQGIVSDRSPAETKRVHMVVMPPSLLFNWESELSRFAPQLRVCTYRGLDRSTDFSEVDVVLTSYDLIRRDIEKLSKIPFHVVIFDEAQAVKNLRTGNTSAVRRLQAVFKIALTGTPIENHLGEFWSIIDLVLPGLLGDEKESVGSKTRSEENRISALISRTKPFILRRTKEMIATELPPRIEMELHLDMSERQKTLYRQTVDELRGAVSSAYEEQKAGQARITALTALTRLRRLCLDPRLIGAESNQASPKIMTLCDRLQELRDEGHSVLVFSQFTTFLDLVEPELTNRKISWLRLDGSTPVGQRKVLVQKFQGSSEPQVFLLSLKAGGRGLNLTRANYVIHLDPWWNPAVENQASDRAHRIGQTQTVTVIRLLMKHTVEEKMMVLKSRKERLFKALLDEGRDTGTIPFSREDFEFLISD